MANICFSEILRSVNHVLLKEPFTQIACFKRAKNKCFTLAVAPADDNVAHTHSKDTQVSLRLRSVKPALGEAGVFADCGSVLVGAVTRDATEALN